MHWGMNDEAFAYLLQRLPAHGRKPCVIDLSYNALTDESLPSINEAESQGFAFKLEHNPFTVSRNPPTISQPPSSFLILAEPYQTITVLSKEIQKLTANVNKTTINVATVSEDVEKLRSMIEGHDRFIKKLSEQYEHMIQGTVENAFPKFRPLNQETRDWLKSAELQCDVALISEDKTEVIIGEVKSHLTMNGYTKAWRQLTARMQIILGVPGNSGAPLPAEFEKVKTCRLLVGCEKIDLDAKTKIQQTQMYLVVPSGSRYEVTCGGKPVVEPK